MFSIFVSWLPIEWRTIPGQDTPQVIGILESPFLIIEGLSSMLIIFFYIVLVGVIFLILEKTGCLLSLFNKLLKGVNYNPYLFSSIIYSFLFLLSSYLGFFEQFIILVPFLISTFKKIGINKKISIIIIIGSLTMGRSFSTLSPYGLLMGYNEIPNTVTNLIGDINTFTLLSIIISLLSLSISLLFLNLFLFFFKDKESKINKDIVESSIENYSINKYKEATVFCLIFIMISVIIVGSIDWTSYFGEGWNKLNIFINKNLDFIFGGSFDFKSIGDWELQDRVIVVFVFVVLIYLILKKDIRSSIFVLISEATTAYLKTYLVFSIAKSIGLSLSMSGWSVFISYSFIIDDNLILFFVSLALASLIFSFFVNSQTTLFIIFTPIISTILINSNIANIELAIFISFMILNLTVGFNSSYTPTQSLNSIILENNNIKRFECFSAWKILVLPNFLIWLFTYLFIFPIFFN